MKSLNSLKGTVRRVIHAYSLGKEKERLRQVLQVVKAVVQEYETRYLKDS